MKSAEEIADQVDAEHVARHGHKADWEAEGSGGWSTVCRAIELAQRDALEAALDACAIVPGRDGDPGIEGCMAAIRAIIPKEPA